MKDWTRKFLAQDLTKKPISSYEINAAEACKRIKIPFSLWCELSDGLFLTRIMTSIRKSKKAGEDIKYNTAFMAGFACGWVEKSRKIFEFKSNENLT
jgi:hypothetical protein